MNETKSNFENEIFFRKPETIGKKPSKSKIAKRIMRAWKPIVISAIIVNERVEKEIPIKIMIGSFTTKVFGRYE